MLIFTPSLIEIYASQVFHQRTDNIYAFPTPSTTLYDEIHLGSSKPAIITGPSLSHTFNNLTPAPI